MGRVWASSRGQARAVYGASQKSGPYYHDLRAREAGCKKGSYYFKNNDKCDPNLARELGFDTSYAGTYPENDRQYKPMWDAWEEMTGFNQYPKTVEVEEVDEKSGEKVKVKKTLHLPDNWKATHKAKLDAALDAAEKILKNTGYDDAEKGHSAGRAIDIMFMKGNKEILAKAGELSKVSVAWPKVAEKDHWHVPVAVAESKEISEVIRKVIKKI